ncbi:hypothetical protein ACQP1G_19765 [Nocardia sp. CA-107356]|uniref:hypothetical protein n=1 Tax=Nocardia sp. CA-107356 TaxID=3239972 RepID=UPI003D8EEE98
MREGECLVRAELVLRDLETQWFDATFFALFRHAQDFDGEIAEFVGTDVAEIDRCIAVSVRGTLCEGHVVTLGITRHKPESSSGNLCSGVIGELQTYSAVGLDRPVLVLPPFEGSRYPIASVDRGEGPGPANDPSIRFDYRNLVRQPRERHRCFIDPCTKTQRRSDFRHCSGVVLQLDYGVLHVVKSVPEGFDQLTGLVFHTPGVIFGDWTFPAGGLAELAGVHGTPLSDDCSFTEWLSGGDATRQEGVMWITYVACYSKWRSGCPHRVAATRSLPGGRPELAESVR